jgi:hypothetical protein
MKPRCSPYPSRLLPLSLLLLLVIGHTALAATRGRCVTPPTDGLPPSSSEACHVQDGTDPVILTGHPKNLEEISALRQSFQRWRLWLISTMKRHGSAGSDIPHP